MQTRFIEREIIIETVGLNYQVTEFYDRFNRLVNRKLNEIVRTKRRHNYMRNKGGMNVSVY